jgi:hypothetical protein
MFLMLKQLKASGSDACPLQKKWVFDNAGSSPSQRNDDCDALIQAPRIASPINEAILSRSRRRTTGRFQWKYLRTSNCFKTRYRSSPRKDSGGISR